MYVHVCADQYPKGKSAGDVLNLIIFLNFCRRVSSDLLSLPPSHVFSFTFYLPPFLSSVRSSPPRYHASRHMSQSFLLLHYIIYFFLSFSYMYHILTSTCWSSSLVLVSRFKQSPRQSSLKTTNKLRGSKRPIYADNSHTSSFDEKGIKLFNTRQPAQPTVSMTSSKIKTA